MNGDGLRPIMQGVYTGLTREDLTIMNHVVQDANGTKSRARHIAVLQSLVRAQQEGQSRKANDSKRIL